MKQPSGTTSVDGSDSIGNSTTLLRSPIVRTEDDKIKAPNNIIATEAAARQIYFKYRTDHLKRIQLYASIEGLLSGNPPYDPAELAKLGLSHIANFNPLDGRALYERSALAYWNLLNSAEFIAKFELDIPNEPQKTNWQNIMAQEFNRVVRRWPSFNTQVNTLSAQIIKFGLSVCIWPDEDDWKWRVVELNKFFIEDQASTDVEQLTAICVETNFTAQYLFEIYNEIKDMKEDETPWNAEALAQLLLFRANTGRKAGTALEPFLDAMDIQRKVQNGDITWDEVYSDSIRIISLLYKEYDEKWSHYMFDRFYSCNDFLFFIDRQYECLTEGMVIFTASPGEFTLHSNRGLGHKIFSGVQAMMQLDCSAVDGARWATTPLLRSLATGSKDFEQIRFYPGAPTHIGSAEFVQNTMGANLNNVMGVSQYIFQKLNFNAANSGDDPGMPDRDKGSVAPEVAKNRSYREFGILKHNIAHFYSTFDSVIKNMASKMISSKQECKGYEDARDWIDSCIARGVPKEIFETGNLNKLNYNLPKTFKDVKASRVAGDGSTLARIMGLEGLVGMGVTGDFGPDEIKEFRREAIIATMGVDYLDTFLPDADEVDEQRGGASLAGVENNSMVQGMSPIFSLDNEHRSHIVTHIALANDIIRQIKEQKMSPIEADKVFTTLIPHTQEHLQAISRLMFAQNFLEQIKRPWNEIEEYARFNRKNAAAMYQKELRDRQKAQQQQEQVMSDAERKDFVAKTDARRKDIESQEKMARSAQQSEARAEIQKRSVELAAENKNLEIRLKNTQQTKEDLKNQTTEEVEEGLQTLIGESPAVFDFERPRT